MINLKYIAILFMLPAFMTYYCGIQTEFENNPLKWENRGFAIRMYIILFIIVGVIEYLKPWEIR